MNHLVVISGCSGGGKSTLLAELARRGYGVVDEPGRRIVRDELARNGTALPWIDGAAFARRAMSLAHADRAASLQSGDWVFFDRSLVDAAAHLQQLTGEPVLKSLAEPRLYHRCVFLVPPWPEIYETDAERQHDFTDAVAEYERLLIAYPALGYGIAVLPKVSVAARAEIILHMLEG
jgi:predicted ATPase